MIVTQSMTGFARGSVTTGAISVTVECRSVNNRFLDLHFRMPDALRSIENGLREKASAYCSRGKLEFTIRASDTGENTTAAIDSERLLALQSALASIAENFPEAAQPDQLALLMAPGVLIEREQDVAALQAATLEAADACLAELRQQRSQEGEKLAAMIRQRAETMRVQLRALRDRLPELQGAYRARLMERFTAIDIDADPIRLEEEVVYVLQRADVEEEMDRLDAHLDAIETALTNDGPCGRRLDFLMQELNREANTLGSKSTALSTTNTSVDFKVLIEQMREQIQNIE
ncbi:MAG: YicC family protein [Halieaceae bacterium]|nr:YicC family protein [Halieaceae bacterium]|tara:strand:+ start:701 stop:1570 length:870 start_codon:yes stop_codon:yes gene_type:complete